MAKIHEEAIVIKVSKLVKDSADVGTIVPDDITTALQSVAEELLGDSVVVEVERA
jgi:hypothetical protein